MKHKTLLLVLILMSFQLLKAQESNALDSIYSNVLDENRQFWVKLPEGYNPENATKYPVIYLLDGVSLKGNLVTVYNNYWGHYLPNMILVGVSNQPNRTRDLTTSKIESRRGAAFNYETGGAENFTQFLEKELIPHIDTNYKTSKYRTLIGHSFAGLFTINTLINHTHLFKNYIAIDPSLDWDNQKLLNQAKTVFKEKDFSGKGLFVSLAAEQLHMFDSSITMDNITEDTSEFTLFARSIIEFSKLAESNSKNGLNFSWKVYPEDLHGTVPLPSMRDGLVFLFKWFQFVNPPKYNNPDTTVDELKQLLIAQGEIYTKHFGEPTPPMIEELFNAYGYMNVQMGQPEKAKLFFSEYIKYYPKSAVAYEGMSDYYSSQNDKAKALEFMNKAYKISQSDYHKKKIEDLKK
ncbi:alpha/beta hydrolase-fold protein [Pontimicrobium sp. IMCC45349]|uniref:alpha/beta hydrolase-fold protein n=1 Tax=Pontimicrobium sp. IMCC45349 TaxID=3391574 RepID=UPI0039A11206